ncbi:LEA type 2 family protein [Pyxidicoccus fallax]|uniref:LEA type 2 family protein n=1 Tax=Pyxidicoccus fallax TaxID=394095 RepID=A0A848L759_9BACT|nr:LEA type 2 family protein [Pyxidicoccus fallax]NMO14820.1 LEA type 2 family protein [Pyxidicoccus fallax]NPC76789.1 LEA type 2 family protein [Pyxidicoccus fallax]
MSNVMRSNPPLLCLATLLVLGLGCASAPTRPSGPAVLTSQDTTVVSQGLTEATVRYRAQVASPAAGVVERAEYELVSDGQVVKTGTAKLDVRLEPGIPADLSFEERAPYVKSEEDLARLSNQGGTLLLALRGTLVVRSGEQEEKVPFAASRAARVPRLPKVVVVELDGARYSPEEVQINLRLGVQNPNPFPLKLGGLTFQVAVAGKSLESGTLAQADSVDASATGVYPVEVAVTKDTWGPDVKALISKGILPYGVTGELTGPLLRVPYSLTGEVKLNVSR